MPSLVQEFTLPVGYHDAQGRTHRHGFMRLATALDEIEPLSDPRVQANEAALGLLLLSRVVTRLGDISPVGVDVIAGLYAADFAYLQDLYISLNSASSMPTPAARQAMPAPQPTLIQTICPNCQAELTLDLSETE